MIFNPSGYKSDKPKLLIVFSISIFWVFLYTAQNAEIKYQKNETKIKVIVKNKVNFIFNFLFKKTDCFKASFGFGIFFIITMSLLDNPSFFITTLIKQEIIVE